MSGYQFIHMQTHALSRSKKQTEGAQTVDYVLAEARREAGTTPHVEDPRPPVIVFGDLQGIEGVIEERRAAIKEATGRAPRKDRRVMASFVASYPVPREELEQDAEAMAAYTRWEADTLDFVRRHGSDRADLITAVRHVDERFMHVHCYLVPTAEQGLAADELHPVKAATAAAEDKAQKHAAGRAAGREFQDRYHREVGEPHGLTRLGPGRRRLSRDAWRAEQAEAERQQSNAQHANEDRLAAVKERAAAARDRAQAAVELKEARLVAEEARGLLTRLKSHLRVMSERLMRAARSRGVEVEPEEGPSP